MSYYRSYRKKLESASTKVKLIYFVLRASVIAILIRELMTRNFYNAFLCVISLLLFTVPGFISEHYNIGLPDTLEIIIYIFIYSSEILGEIDDFYLLFPYWDTLLHCVNGFLCAAIGFSLVDILNHNSKHIRLSPAYLSLAAFCFSMTVGVSWEFFELSADRFLLADMQKDTIVERISSIELNPDRVNRPVIINDIVETQITTADGSVYVIEGGYLDVGLYDTMNDLFVNLIGAAVFSFFGYFYIKYRDINHTFIAERFIPYVEDPSDQSEKAS